MKLSTSAGVKCFALAIKGKMESVSSVSTMLVASFGFGMYEVYESSLGCEIERLFFVYGK